MASTRERTPQERETLLFSDPEAAQAWQEKIGEQLQQVKSPVVDRRRAVVAEAVAEEFAQAGVAVTTIREPWIHTQAEHEEAQHLVDVAFAQDLPTAIKLAQKSPHYPRNLDLFHDVLTGEMYDLLQESEISRQPLLGWLLLLFIIACAVVILILMLSIWS